MELQGGKWKCPAQNTKVVLDLWGTRGCQINGKKTVAFVSLLEFSRGATAGDVKLEFCPTAVRQY
jgi:hypothetical protein